MHQNWQKESHTLKKCDQNMTNISQFLARFIKCWRQICKKTCKMLRIVFESGTVQKCKNRVESDVQKCKTSMHLQNKSASIQWRTSPQESYHCLFAHPQISGHEYRRRPGHRLLDEAEVSLRTSFLKGTISGSVKTLVNQLTVNTLQIQRRL